MKLLRTLLLIPLLAYFFLPLQIFAQETEKIEDNYFIVTAYYSPLPDQKYYLTGNYEDEVILNGAWVAWASGKKVFSGMLAAPAKYSFGTKIYLDGLGIGSVEDRGGAIVPAGERGYGHDRIDVWMGYGDEWLQRALFWGKRKVMGYVVDSGNTPTINYTDIPTSVSLTPWSSSNSYSLAQESKKIKLDETIFSTPLNKESTGADVKRLQEILFELSYFQNESFITGKYDRDTIDAIYNFQKTNGLVTSETDAWAGVYGPKTRKKLSELYTQYQKNIEEEKKMLESVSKLRDEAFKIAEEKIQKIGKPIYGDISPEVRSLQKLLSDMGYFPYKDTAIFGVKTQNALLDYQVEKKLISQLDEQGAWSFWPGTRAEITKDLTEKEFQILLKKSEYYEAYTEYSKENSLENDEVSLKIDNTEVIQRI